MLSGYVSIINIETDCFFLHVDTKVLILKVVFQPFLSIIIWNMLRECKYFKYRSFKHMFKQIIEKNVKVKVLAFSCVTLHTL